MKQKFLNFLETKGITADDFASKDVSTVANLHSEYVETLTKSLEESVEKSATKEDLGAIKTELLEANKELLKSFNDLNVATFEQGKALKKLMDEGNTSELTNSLTKQVKDNFAVIKEIAKGSNKEIVVKASTNRASISGNEQAFDLPDIGQLATRRLSLYDLFPKVPVSSSNNQGVIRYYDWDEVTVARAAAMVAEGGAFPESTAKWLKGSISLQKIGDSIPVTEEMLEDEAMFASELEMFLQINVELVQDDQLCNGSGTGSNLTGIFTSAPAYTAVASGIAGASIYDLIVKMSEDITTTGGAKYMPNFAIARQSVINQMRLTKDANENYVMPPFVTRDGREVAGITVVESNIAPANALLIGDNRFARIYEKGGIELAKGEVNGQFLEDEMTLKARKRLAFLIRNADKGGFRKVTDVNAALVTLAS